MKKLGWMNGNTRKDRIKNEKKLGKLEVAPIN